MPPDSDETAVRTVRQARQGVTGHNVRIMLLGGMFLVVMAFLVIATFMH